MEATSTSSGITSQKAASRQWIQRQRHALQALTLITT